MFPEASRYWLDGWSYLYSYSKANWLLILSATAYSSRRARLGQGFMTPAPAHTARPRQKPGGYG